MTRVLSFYLATERFAQIVVLFANFRIIQTLVEIVDLQTVRLAECLPLAELNAGHLRFDRRFALADAEVVLAVVHDAVVVVLEAVGGVFERLLFEVRFKRCKENVNYIIIQ